VDPQLMRDVCKVSVRLLTCSLVGTYLFGLCHVLTLRQNSHWQDTQGRMGHSPFSIYIHCIESREERDSYWLEEARKAPRR
jgi:hypothetical protein